MLMISDNDFKCKDYVKSSITEQCVNASEDSGFCKIPTRFRCPLAVQSTTFKLSHSTIQDYFLCKRYFWLRNIIGLVTKPHKVSIPIKQGRLWDKLQDLFYGYCKQEDVKILLEEICLPEIEIARVRGVYKAFCECIKLLKHDLIGTQQHFCYEHFDTFNGDILVHGHIDRLYSDWLAECKFTSRPEYYDEPFLVTSQIGTYLLSNENLKGAVIEIVKVPDLKPKKQSRNRLNDETPDEFRNRVYEDVISRPSYYFLGYKRETKTYGLDFPRELFDLNALKNRYRWVIREIKERGQRNTWYPEEKGCNAYNSKCDFYHMCKMTWGGEFRPDWNKFEIRKHETEALRDFIKNGS